MYGTCYDGLMEGYRQALLQAIHSACAQSNNIYAELKCRLKAETELNRIFAQASKDYLSCTSDEATTFITKRILVLYDEIVYTIPAPLSYDEIKTEAKNFVKGQSHNSNKGGCPHGRKNNKHNKH